MARYFDGTAQNIEYTGGPLSTAVDNVTFGLWVYYPTAVNEDVLCYNGNSGLNGYGFHYRNSSGVMQILFGGITWSFSISMSADTWTHLAARRESGTWKVFKNGVKDAASTTQAPNTPTTEFWIGYDVNAANADEKRVAEYFFSNRAMSDAEIDSIGANYVSPLFFDVDHYYPLGGIVASDSDVDIIGKIDLTPNGSPGVVDHPPIIYPTSPIVVNSSEAAAPAGGSNSLTLLGVG